MKTTSQLYKQFLLISQINYTGTYLADHIEGLDENSIYRFLKGNIFTPKMVWEKTEANIIFSPDGKILFDDTVLDKDFSFKIDGVRSQYSGNAHGIIKGIGVVNCVYYNPELDRFWIIDFRIFDKERDGKTKIDHVHDMIRSILEREILFSTVLMDSWYSDMKTLLWIDSLQKLFYCPIKSNRLVDDSLGKCPYRAVDKLEWNDTEETHGKSIKVKKFPKNYKVNLFRVVVSTDKTEYVITNDMTQDSTEGCRKETAIRWKIEQFHREAKQVTGIEKNQCRTNRSQRNHICLAIQVWVFLSEKAHTLGTTIYQVKRGLLDEYMVEQLRNSRLMYS
jgi:hypothetical protein